MAQAAYRLVCKVQQYDWGKVGKDSTVAQFAASGDASFKLDEASPYAELWMGTHPKAPSSITLADGLSMPLADWIKGNRWALTDPIADKFSDKLPFLFKVLSINKALSIQAHPNKALAEELHAKDPAHYADDNHKPEMAIALTPFEGMCGFRPVDDIAKHMTAYPEFAAAVGQQQAQALIEVAGGAEADAKGPLKQCFAGLMTQGAAVVKEQLAALVARVEQISADKQTPLEALLIRLNTQYPGGDVGCFCIFFLNVVNLVPGEALFLGPNEPHAYLFGDCVECMATSDNVVRAGLTPKFKDVDYLVEMLTYRAEGAEEQVERGVVDKDTPTRTVYRTPVPEFDIARMSVPAGSSTALTAVAGPSIVIVTAGSGTAELIQGSPEPLTTGQVLFVPAGGQPTVAAGEAEVVVHVAFAEAS
eukprot:m.448212 g.448212  ORF g.448212 m.448212 type:complete len:419 (-) comp19630_c0_seq1:90-1346(-)